MTLIGMLIALLSLGCVDEQPTAPQPAESPHPAAAVEDAPAAPPETASLEEPRVLKVPELPPPEGAKRLIPDEFVWVDVKRRLVYVDGYVALRDGYLEMFACPANTKEHESIVAVRSRAQTVHAGLLAVGAKPGHPVEYQPEFRPATGDVIEVEVLWLDEKQLVELAEHGLEPRQELAWKRARAQEWIRNLKTKKQMTEPWVFGGSGFWKEESTGRRHYMAEAGDLICVSNFTTAMLDVPIESSQANEGLLFAADEAKIPPLGAPVRLVLSPPRDDGEKEPEPAAKP